MVVAEGAEVEARAAEAVAEARAEGQETSVATMAVVPADLRSQSASVFPRVGTAGR